MNGGCDSCLDSPYSRVSLVVAALLALLLPAALTPVHAATDHGCEAEDDLRGPCFLCLHFTHDLSVADLAPEAAPVSAPSAPFPAAGNAAAGNATARLATARAPPLPF